MFAMSRGILAGIHLPRMPTDQALQRDFCIVAHVDHGKSTLADRILEITHAVSEREMRAQYIDKIDLPQAQPERVAQELQQVIGCRDDEIVFASGKSGEGVIDLLEAIVAKVPPPSGDKLGPTRALIFDSVYDAYRGVISYVRV